MGKWQFEKVLLLIAILVGKAIKEKKIVEI